MDPTDLYSRLPQPSPGGDIHQLPIGNNTYYLYNDGSSAPTPTTSTTLPPSAPGAAYAGELPPGMDAQSWAQKMAQWGLTPMGQVAPTRHEQFGNLRSLSRMLHDSSLPDEQLFPLLQHLWNQGTVYSEGGEGMGTSVPFYDPHKRILDLFERYQDYLNAGNPVANPGQAPGFLGTMPPMGQR